MDNVQNLNHMAWHCFLNRQYFSVVEVFSVQFERVRSFVQPALPEDQELNYFDFKQIEMVTLLIKNETTHTGISSKNEA
jgi:hypothetical protein